MKKLFALLMAAMMLVCMLAGCGEQKNNGNAQGEPNQGNVDTPQDETDPSGEDDSVVNLMDMYSVEDPEGVEYDQRVALYMPVQESDESYATGVRHDFAVLYGKENKGVYMYDVEMFDSEESATAFQEAAGEGTVDGTAYIAESDADFFAAMEAFIPDFQTYIDNMMMSGMVELD